MNEKLKQKFNDVMAEAGVVLEQFPWEDPVAYGLWLQQTYYFVENSTRLIGLAGCLFPKERTDLHQRFIDHCKEERGHEKLLTRDIEQLGLKQSELQVFPSTQAFYQCQFYWIEHVNPISFFGYILFLEGLAVVHARTLISRIEKALNPKSLSFFKVHSDEDEDHLDKAFKLVDKATPAEIELIVQNMELSSKMYFQFLKDITALVKTSNRSNRKAS